MCGDTVTTLEPLLVGDVLGVNNLLKKSYNGQNNNVILKKKEKESRIRAMSNFAKLIKTRQD